MVESPKELLVPEVAQNEETDHDQPIHTLAAIEIEAGQDEVDSTRGDDISCASASLCSSVLDYEYKHGRRYYSHHVGTYNFPNDDEEEGRLGMVHHAYTLALDDRLFLAPIDPNGLRILDIGTGTGIWPIELGDEYPGATVIGNDLSPIQPCWLPPNVRFLIDDVEEDWNEPEPYDYIHCRYMAGSIKDWPRLFQQIFDNLKPGGWVEFRETANTKFVNTHRIVVEVDMMGKIGLQYSFTLLTNDNQL
ncbi:hypothetical protein QQZ08_011585 [Neonectria magnoliae]|uniref:Secondary metabolism regulator LAE1 n=1 Tax=Neonectria magnoliae TaxID=2732573 RepID=A0ABR1H8X1_9HYPO